MESELAELINPFGRMPSLCRAARGDLPSPEARSGAPEALGLDGSARLGRMAGMHSKSIQG
jgi:hypothetical protein